MNTSSPLPNISCNHCSTNFYKKPAEIKRSSTHFCSRDCAIEYRKSLKHIYYTEVECLNCGNKFNKKNAEIKIEVINNVPNDNLRLVRKLSNLR